MTCGQGERWREARENWLAGGGGLSETEGDWWRVGGLFLVWATIPLLQMKCSLSDEPTV